MNLVWYDLMTPDPKSAQDFYGSLLGWTVRSMGDYPIFYTGEEGLGGVAQGAPQWRAYARVESVDASLARVEALGGRIEKAGTDIPGTGRYGVFHDPQGATLALFESARPQPVENRGPGRFCWHQLLTGDPAGAAHFYAELLGCGVEAVEGCQLLSRDGEVVAGVMQSPNGLTHWLHYLHWLDPDRGAERVAELGGRVLVAPHDHAGMGRFTVVADPQGACFALYRPAEVFHTT